MPVSSELSLYIHIPFCQKKCPYCDFNTFAGLNRLHESFTDALVQEIELAGAQRNRPAVKTVFIGGGTPTVLPPIQLNRILTTIRRAFRILPDAEITSEANPGTVDSLRFAALRQMDINRLSLGVQSFDDGELQFLGRIHDAATARAAVGAARRTGFNNINLDLIFGLPFQTTATWRASLRQAIDLHPEHLSLYSLTIEENTPFADWAAAGRFPYPDPDRAADLYEIAVELLADAGYLQYEISNWARADAHSTHEPGESAISGPECRHNLTYWRNETYLGFGPGAHSSERGVRWSNQRLVPEFIRTIGNGSSPVDSAEEIDAPLAMGETMMLGLRLTEEGVGYQRFERKHGAALIDVFGQEVVELTRLGLLEQLPDRIRLAPEARLIGNQVFVRFLP
ncbi:MAG: radical SAM family heme chaperone HemW [Chloroflexota bacterium]|nr:radical SAM family heme chaperone HemW [Chloroflexota bacterium]